MRKNIYSANTRTVITTSIISMHIELSFYIILFGKDHFLTHSMLTGCDSVKIYAA